MNGDSFTIQLRDLQNRLHSLRKNALRNLEPQGGASVMPSYRTTLTPGEIEDLVAYLAGLRGEP